MYTMNKLFTIRQDSTSGKATWTCTREEEERKGRRRGREGGGGEKEESEGRKRGRDRTDVKVE